MYAPGGANTSSQQPGDQGQQPGDQSQPPGPPAPKDCQALKKFTYTQMNALTLQCSPSNADRIIFDVQIPAEGRAFARATFDLFNFAPAGDPLIGAHAWTGTGFIGDQSFAQRIGGGAGQTVCPGQGQQSQQVLTYGMLNANSKSVRIQMKQYNSSACTNGSIIIQPGAKLEVWVEDPGCAGENIIAASYFRDVRSKTGVETPFALTTATQDVLSTNFTVGAAKSALAYGQMEATMPTTANRCGSQGETSSAALGLDGNYLNSGSIGGWPASGGETHIALFPAASFQIPKGNHRLHLAATVNQSVNSGRAKVGLDHSADTIFVAILEPNSAVVATNVELGNVHKIMALGDSITLGYEDTSVDARGGINGGYRYFLYYHLANRGFKFNFVGSLATGPNDLPQKQNEGHSGYRIDQIRDGLIQNGWVKNTKPDLILLHIGTNDFFQNYDLQNSPGRLSALLDQIYADAPAAKVVVAKIVPMPAYPAYDAYVADFNNSVGLVAAQKQAMGRAVYVVDMNSALSGVSGSSDFCSDQAHPNRQGYSKMADVWIRALVQML